MYRHYPKKIKHYPSFKTLKKSLIPHTRMLVGDRVALMKERLQQEYVKYAMNAIIGILELRMNTTNQQIWASTLRPTGSQLVIFSSISNTV